MLLALVQTVAVETASAQSTMQRLLLLLSLLHAAYLTEKLMAQLTRTRTWRNPVFAESPMLWRQLSPPLLHLLQIPRVHQGMMPLGPGRWTWRLLCLLLHQRAGLSSSPQQ